MVSTAHGVILALALTASACTRAPGERLLVEVETVENALDDTPRPGCGLRQEVDAGTKHDSWISFGDVQPHAERGWAAVRTRLHCGPGSRATASTQFDRLFGTPYVVLDLEVLPTVSAPGAVRLNTSLRIQELSGFDNGGRALYRTRVENRSLDLGKDGEMLFPVLIADDREKEAFGVDDVLLRVRVTTAGDNPQAAYGAVSVTADVPGAEILLDGGLVGRISEGKPTVVSNVLVGKREVRVRDFSGREASADVMVERDRVVETSLPVLNLPASGGATDFVPLGENPLGYEEYWRPKDGAVVVRVPPGEFLMGSSEGSGEVDERPQHTVDLSEFRIDKTEVTWRQFHKFTQATGSSSPAAPIWGTPDDYAVSNVVWDEAKAYCEWVGGRLPTEAEWEKAARGTDGRQHPWGPWEPLRCNSFGELSEGGPHRPESVGSFPGCVSPYGVLDLAGSVWEWCADWYGQKYYAESPARNPTGPATGDQRVLRGGAWISQRSWLRTAYRHKTTPSTRYVHNGFRCVHDVEE